LDLEVLFATPKSSNKSTTKSFAKKTGGDYDGLRIENEEDELLE